MATKTKQGRVSKAQWLAKALELFTREGEPGVRIEVLAREVGVAKAGFYWHFKDRADLLDQLLDFWTHEYTEVVTRNTALRDLKPRERLLATMQMIYDHDLAGLDVHFHAWARKDPRVARKVNAVIRKRLEWLRGIFAEAGFNGDDLEMRARLAVAYESNESLMFRFKKKGEASRLRKLRLSLLFGPSEE